MSSFESAPGSFPCRLGVDRAIVLMRDDVEAAVLPVVSFYCQTGLVLQCDPMSSRRAPGLEDLDALSALADQSRRRLYDYVSASPEPVGRDEAAAAAGVGRSLAAYHLDQLAEAGLLQTTFARPPGRSGPGAGRPAKLYRRAERDFALRAPSRDYALLAEIFVRAEEHDPAAHEAVASAARELGKELGAEAKRADLVEILRARGYEPFDDDGVIRFRNCPFHALAQSHRGSVCTLNLALVEGILAGAGATRMRASLEPDRAQCCVALAPARSRRSR
jgi:predicted ArsR family transcriptional regulator